MTSARLLPAIILFFVAQTANAQDNQIQTIDSLSAQLIQTIRNTEREQSYVTTDKSIYAPGEMIWFRAFLLHSASQKPSSASKTLFVDLVNESDSVINRLLLHAKVHQLNGRFSLPDNLPQGYYWLRAYTQNM